MISYKEYLEKVKTVPFRKGAYVATRFYVDKRYIRIFIQLELCHKEENFVVFKDLIMRQPRKFLHVEEKPFCITKKEFDVLKEKGSIRLPSTIDFKEYLFEPETEIYYFRTYEDIYSKWVNETTILYSYLSKLSLEEIQKHEFALTE